MITKAAVGNNIASVRKEAGMTQKEVSKKAEISTTQLSAYENGKQMPGLPTLANIAVALGTTIDRLYFGSGSESFITQSVNEGETVVNCIHKLQKLDVIDDLTYDPEINEYVIALKRYGESLCGLWNSLFEVEVNREYTENADVYIEQVRQVAINKINSEIKLNLVIYDEEIPF